MQAVSSCMLRIAIVLFALCGAVASAASDKFDGLIGNARAAMLADPQLAVRTALAAQRYAEAQPQSNRREVMRATAQWLRGEALVRTNDVSAAEPLIVAALKTASRLAPGSKLHADLLLSSGSINTIRANVAKALNDYQQAHALFLKLGDVRSQAKALQLIGALYSGARDYRSALRYYDQAVAIYRGDPNLLLSIYNNRGIALKELGRPREAERQFRDALVLAEQMNSTLLRLLVLSNVADARLAFGNIAGAQRVIDEGLRLSGTAEAAGFRPQLIALAAQANYQRGELARAVALIDRRFAGENLAKSTLVDRQAHQTAYDIYRAVGRDDLALAHLAALKRLDDEATDLARSTNAALMAARFDFANQELRIANLQRDEARRSVAFEQARARTQQTVFLGVAAATAIVIALLAIGLFTIRRSRNQVRAANADLAVTNQALGKALAAKTEFLATTSHEIRTPLNGILGMTQVMLADTGVGGDVRERLSVVHSAGVTMRALVDDILDVAKMETGNLTIEKAPFDLCAMLIEASRMWEEQARAKGIGFSRDLSASPKRIVGDVTRLRQIIFNLMANALKFTATGEVRLQVVAAGDRLRIVVADTGVGIAADKCEEIFESFRQADTSTTRRFGGTGLGLAISRNLARAMGGDVAVESTLGAGSRFTVELPLELAPAAEEEAAQHDPAALLIVDRNPITRSMLKAVLAPLAGEVVAVASCDDARTRIAAGGIARIVVDASAMDADEEGFAALVALAAGRPLAVLLPPDSAAPTGVLALVKPVTAGNVITALYGCGDQPLVSQAA